MNLVRSFSVFQGVVLIGIIFSGTGVLPAMASTQVMDSELIRSVTIREIQENDSLLLPNLDDLGMRYGEPQQAHESFPFLDDLNSASSVCNVILDNILNIGKKLWALVEANRPVAHIRSNRANAVPQGVVYWEHMEDWQAPVSKVFQVSYDSVFGNTVVDFTYRLVYTYGGKVNGKGHYLANIVVVPAELTVLSGYTFNADVSFPGAVNVGTVEAPIAGTEVLVKWSADHWWRHSEGSHTFFIRGDGAFSDLSAGQSADSKG